jgi:hypothetical protein
MRRRRDARPRPDRGCRRKGQSGTAATELLRAGCSLNEIAVATGWRLRHAGNLIEKYAALVPDVSDEVLEKLKKARAKEAESKLTEKARGAKWTCGSAQVRTQVVSFLSNSTIHRRGRPHGFSLGPPRRLRCSNISDILENRRM